jgi:hypothetical protein
MWAAVTFCLASFLLSTPLQPGVWPQHTPSSSSAGGPHIRAQWVGTRLLGHSQEEWFRVCGVCWACCMPPRGVDSRRLFVSVPVPRGVACSPPPKELQGHTVGCWGRELCRELCALWC